MLYWHMYTDLLRLNSIEYTSLILRRRHVIWFGNDDDDD